MTNSETSHIDLDTLTCIDKVTRDELIQNGTHKFVKANEIILKEHDLADCMFVIVSGKVSIFITDSDNHDIELGVMEKGCYFGEQAILSSEQRRRNASIIAIVDTQLLEVSKELFHKVVDKDPKLVEDLKTLGENQLRHRLMQESELFRSIYLGIPIQRALSEASYYKGQTIYKTGDEDNFFYLVLWGAAEIIDNTNTKNFIGPGRFFGERELLMHCTRKQTVVAKTELLTLKIEGNKFLDLYHDNLSFQQLILKKSNTTKPTLVAEPV